MRVRVVVHRPGPVFHPSQGTVTDEAVAEREIETGRAGHGYRRRRAASWALASGYAVGVGILLRDKEASRNAAPARRVYRHYGQAGRLQHSAPPSTSLNEETVVMYTRSERDRWCHRRTGEEPGFGGRRLAYRLVHPRRPGRTRLKPAAQRVVCRRRPPQRPQDFSPRGLPDFPSNYPVACFRNSRFIAWPRWQSRSQGQPPCGMRAAQSRLMRYGSQTVNGKAMRILINLNHLPPRMLTTFYLPIQIRCPGGSQAAHLRSALAGRRMARWDDFHPFSSIDSDIVGFLSQESF